MLGHLTSGVKRDIRKGQANETYSGPDAFSLCRKFGELVKERHSKGKCRMPDLFTPLLRRR